MILAILCFIAIAAQITTAIRQIRKTKELTEMINKLSEYEKEDIVIVSKLIDKHNETVAKANEYLDETKNIIDFIIQNRGSYEAINACIKEK